MITPESDCRVSGARLALATGAFDDHQVQVHEDQHARRGTGPGFEQGKWSSLFPMPGTNGWLTSVGASSCPGDEGGLSEEDKARSR